ncbi:hypothetical protein [Ruegeria hyattellae]|uniref:hypothetical protein n=1 Tax=Ruegeria hyattellae TaxID=3233337 RepID=UPI00355C3463
MRTSGIRIGREGIHSPARTMRRAGQCLPVLAALALFDAALAQVPDDFTSADMMTVGSIRRIIDWTVRMAPPNIESFGAELDMHLVPPGTPDDIVLQGEAAAAADLAALTAGARLSVDSGGPGPELRPGQMSTIPLSLDFEGLAVGEEIHVAVFSGVRGGLLLEKVPRILNEDVPAFSGITITASDARLDGTHLTTMPDGAIGPEYGRYASRTTRIRLEAELRAGSLSAITFDASHFPAHFAVPINHMTDGIRNYVILMGRAAAAKTGGSEAAFELEEIRAMSLEPVRPSSNVTAGVNTEDGGVIHVDAEEVLDLIAKMTLDPVSDGAYANDADMVADAPVYFNIVHVATALGPALESVTARLTLRPPELPFDYDAVVLVPVILKRKRTGFPVVIADTERMPPISIAVAPETGRAAFPETFVPPMEPDTAPTEWEQPELSIATAPGMINLEETITLPFRIAHGPAPAGADLYVVLQPVAALTNNPILGGESGVTELASQNDITFSTCDDQVELQSTFMRVRQSPLQVRSEGFWNTGFDAGRIGTVSAAEGGVIEGVLTFTPPLPPSGTVYDRIRAIPLLLAWDITDGRQCGTIVLRSDQGTDIPVRYLQFWEWVSPSGAASLP